MDAYEEWNQLYDDNVYKVWKEEPVLRLKAISMLYFCFNQELKKLQKSVQDQFDSLKNPLFTKPVDIVPIVSTDSCSELDEPNTKASHNLKVNKSETNTSNDSGSIVISDDDFCAQTTGISPEIKRCFKKVRQKSRQKIKRNFNEDCPKVEIIKTFSSDTEKIIKEVMNGSKPKDNLDLPNTVKLNEVQARQATKRNSLEAIDFIESTPVAKAQKKKRCFSKNNSTLTQMFLKSGSSLNSDKSEIVSQMGITSMLNYLNQETPQDSNQTSNSDISLNSGMLEESQLSLEDELLNENAPNKKVEGQDKVDNLNSFLAQAQNVSQQHEAAPVVRGKLRQRLPAWTCRECEKYFANQGLKPDEVLAFNKCFKHRGRFKPREDTLSGYWDISMSTPDK